MLNDLDDFFLKAYEGSSIYKDKMKKYDYQKIEKREFVVGDLVLLLNSKLRLLQGKHKSKWMGPFVITKVFHMEQLSKRIMRVQSSQSTGKGLRSTYGRRRVSMKWLRHITLTKSG